MAYVSNYINQFNATRAAFIPNLWSHMVNMGWTLFDTGAGTSPLQTISVPFTSVDINAETITYNSHGYNNGNLIIYIQGTTAIGGLTTNTLYYVVGATQNTFQLSSTQGGGALNLTSQGSGNHTFGEGFRVYSSNGESADRITEYIYINIVTADKISFQAYYLWAATTHVGVGKSSTFGNVNTADTGFYAWLYGNKNIVSIHTKVSSTYYFCGFGHIPQRFWTTLTTSTSVASGGSNVVIATGDTTNFYIGKSYQIVGASGEGRDTVVVNAKTTNSLTITTLPRNYGIGAFIGQTPSTFGNFDPNQHSFNLTCGWTAVGTGTSSATAFISSPLPESSENPDSRAESRYLLQPLIYVESSGAIGYIDAYLLDTGTTGKVTEDTIGVGFYDSGTSTGSNTVNTFNDTSKAWTTNAWATKIIIITNGTGAGQINNIASNTATTITLVTTWQTIPNTSSTYAIYNEGYRYFATGSACAYKEAL